jgi:hypothetical protein
MSPRIVQYLWKSKKELWLQFLFVPSLQILYWPAFQALPSEMQDHSGFQWITPDLSS